MDNIDYKNLYNLEIKEKEECSKHFVPYIIMVCVLIFIAFMFGKDNGRRYEQEHFLDRAKITSCSGRETGLGFKDYSCNLETELSGTIFDIPCGDYQECLMVPKGNIEIEAEKKFEDDFQNAINEVEKEYPNL